MNIRQRRLLWIMLLLLVGGLGLPRSARASVTCANPTIGNVQFGHVNLGTGAVSVTGTISWSCTSAGIVGILLAPQADVAMCLNLNAGTGGTQLDPRLLGNGSSTLQYRLYTNSGYTTVWSSTATTTPLLIHVSIPASLLLTSTKTGTTSFYARLPPGQTAAITGAYTSTLVASVTGSYTNNKNTPIATCTGGQTALNTGSASFTVSATVDKDCLVTANTIDLGAVPSTAANITSSGTLGVTCSNGTPYYVGLAPSNGSSTGAGTMKGTLSGNTDLVPYQLRSTAGLGGTPWGNTATSTSVGNGVAGTGSGLSQPKTVYVTAPNANFRPDSYSDTVTVNVNY